MSDIEEKIEEVIDKDIDLYYLSSPPRKWTFEPPKVNKVVEEELEGTVLNLFAGMTKLEHDGEVIRVDMDEDKDADYNMSALEFLEKTDMNFDTVLLDPPYNVRKSREKYEGEYMGNFTKIKQELVDRINENGKVFTFGYATTGMGKTRGFDKKRVYVINHKGDHNDTLAVVERKK
jgi:hypothetical protein